ncbi:MAG: aldo/keto reductase, partial [Chloroflexota bacterium]
MNVGFGTASFGTTYSKADSFAVLDKYAELGGRMIDTANNYAFWVDGSGLGGQAESVLGEWFASNSREQFHLTTKIGARPAPQGSDRRFDGLGRETVFTAVAECLERLQTDYLDTLQAHFDDPHTPL